MLSLAVATPAVADAAAAAYVSACALCDSVSRAASLPYSLLK